MSNQRIFALERLIEKLITCLFCNGLIYRSLDIADREADSACFIGLMLEIIWDSLQDVTVLGCSTDQDDAPVAKLLAVLGDETLSATELMERLALSHKATFRKNYLNPGLEKYQIEWTIPERPNSRNQKYRKRHQKQRKGYPDF